jgi:hypothetical protein
MVVQAVADSTSSGRRRCAQHRDVDAHEGDAEQEEDRFGDVGPQQLAKRRHRDCGQEHGDDRARGLIAEPAQGLQRNSEWPGIWHRMSDRSESKNARTMKWPRAPAKSHLFTDDDR